MHRSIVQLREFSAILLVLITTFQYNECFSSTKEGIVKVSGISENEKITFIKLQELTYLWDDFSSSIFDLRIVSNQQRFNSQFSLKKPTVLNFMILGKTIKVYVTPGDQIGFKIGKMPSGKPSITFSGKNASNYNYGEQYENRDFTLRQRLNYNGIEPLDSFKLSIDDWYDNEISFVQNFRKAHGDFSDDYYEYTLQDLGYKYASLLYAPFKNKNNPNPKVPTDYFSRLEKIYKSETPYQFSINTLNAFTSKYILFGTTDMENHYSEIYENIIKKFQGKTREYLLSNFLGIFAKRQKDNYRTFLTAKFTEANKYIKDTAYLKYIKKCELNYNMLHRNIHDSITKSTILVSYDGDTLSMEKLFGLYDNKPIYIDLWASWCGACRADIKDSKLTDAYLKENKIARVYFSLDKQSKTNDWRRASKQDGITQDQYLVINEFSSAFIKRLGVQSIPRYLIFSRDHKLISYDAPRPNTAQVEQLRKVFETMKKND